MITHREEVWYILKNRAMNQNFFFIIQKIISLNASNGKYNKSFGKNGVVKLKYPSVTAPAIYKNNLIVTTFSQLWKFMTWLKED